MRKDIKIVYESMEQKDKWVLKRDMYRAKERKYKIDLMWEYLNQIYSEEDFIKRIRKWQKP